jgi:uncharacterized repeat protein (TIGR01451 family)
MPIRHRSTAAPRAALVPPALAFAFVALLAAASSALAQTPTYEDQVMEMLNQERWNNGQLPPLKRNSFLDASSETHSDNMAVRNFFQHCDPDNGSKPWDRMTAAGYTGWSYAAENIAAGYSTPSAVMTGWMNSSGHRANMLSTSSREIGIGYVNATSDQNNIRTDANGDCTSDASNSGPFYKYWTQNFGRKNTTYPVVIAREAFQVTNSTVDLYVYGTGWAQQMRFRNDGGAWSAWQTFAANVSWVLGSGNGLKTVDCEIKNGTTVYAASDQVWLNASADVAVAGVPSVETVDLGDTFTLTVTTSNSGASNATNVMVTHELPAGIEYVSADAAVTVNGNVVTRTLPLLASGANNVLVLTLRGTGAGGKETLVDAMPNEYDPDMSDNVDGVFVNVEASQTGVADLQPGEAAVLALRPSQPNPFSSATRLFWTLPEPAAVSLAIFDAAGRRVATLVDEELPAGHHDLTWGGTDDSGRPLAGGVYFRRLAVGNQVRTGKLLLTR